MRRRQFIGLLGGMAATWPFTTRAQPVTRTHRIGVLMGYSPNDPAGHQRFDALRQGLNDLGWSEGRNLVIDVRFAGADVERIAALSAELVDIQPDAIVANTAS